MMRIVFGIDRARHWKTASDLLPRLRFREGVVDTLHFTDQPIYHFGALDPAIASRMIEEGYTDSCAAGLQRVEEASALLRQNGVTTGVAAVSPGSPPQGLMEYADRMDAQLIAVGSSGKSPVKAFFTGSVGRGLVIGAHQSVLIARGEAARTGPVRAVLATDHSSYMSACLETLLQMAPLGLSHLSILTVYSKQGTELMQPYLPDGTLNPQDWIGARLKVRNQEVIHKLAPLGCTFDSRVMDGDIHEAIKYVMKASHADLLLLGAQGHGFAERLTLGSVSFREAIGEPHSILMLRAAEGGPMKTGE